MIAMEDLIAKLDAAIAADEQMRRDVTFQMGQINGRLEMARAIREELAAAEDAPPNEEGDDDAGE